jgi:hypothetical protein
MFGRIHGSHLREERMQGNTRVPVHVYHRGRPKGGDVGAGARAGPHAGEG